MGDERFYQQLAVELALANIRAGGIPIASVIADEAGLIACGTNQRVQQSSMLLHGETDALNRAGRGQASALRGATIYCSLSPCLMCTGAIVLYGIGRVVILDSETFSGYTDILESNGVTVEYAPNLEVRAALSSFIEENPELWDEDNGGR